MGLKFYLPVDKWANKNATQRKRWWVPNLEHHMGFRQLFVFCTGATIVLLLSFRHTSIRSGDAERTRFEFGRQAPVQVALVPILDEYGQTLDGVFAGLYPHARIAADNRILTPSGQKPYTQASRQFTVFERITTWATPAVVYAFSCPWCFEPGNCTGYHFRCLSVECFPGCGGYRNWCYSDPGWSPAWRGYCISNTTACPQCPECMEQTCYHG